MAKIWQLYAAYSENTKVYLAIILKLMKVNYKKMVHMQHLVDFKWLNYKKYIF